MKKIAAAIAFGGICLPYIGGALGMLFGGRWPIPTSFMGNLFVSLFNSICWIPIAFAVARYRHAEAAKYPVIIGFAMPMLYYATLGSSRSSTASIGIVFVPVVNIILAFIGWRVGCHFDYAD